MKEIDDGAMVYDDEQENLMAAVGPQTASFLGSLDFKSVALLILKPYIMAWVTKTLESPEIKDRLKLTDEQIEGIISYLTRKIDKILK
jgi:hypothetical protein